MAGLVDLGRVDRRLTMLGRDDEQRGLIQSARLERLDHAAEGFVGLLQAIREHCRRRPDAIDIAAGQANVTGLRATAFVGGQLLSDAHRLEVHSEHRRCAPGGRAVMVEAIDLLDDRGDLQLVVRNRAINAGGGVGTAYVGDLGRVEIIDALAGGAVDEIVGRVLVRPCGAATLALDDFEDRIGPDGIMRIDRDALTEPVPSARQLCSDR